jgi:hypothetical protein
MVAIRERLWVAEPGAALSAPASGHARSIEDDVGEQADVFITFDFDAAGTDRGGGVLSEAQQEAFRASVLRERALVLTWFAGHQWHPDLFPDLHTVVSPSFDISRSLVPAWRGQRGRMEFPASRVAAGRAAIAHELTHVYFPNANRLLAEGLALFVQAELGSNPAFPNFGGQLHMLAREVLGESLPEFRRDRLNSVASLRPLHIGDLDVIATPSPLTLTIGPNVFGEGARGQRAVYALAGSFAAFLIETRGILRFRALYLHTPLRPQFCDAGVPDRWLNAYGLSLAELELEWKAMIVNDDHGAVSR